ncbi:MAG: hypothetical protein R3B99_30195 [Polyangiales bacterium]
MPHHARAIDATSTHWSRAGLVESALVALFVLGVALIFGSHPLPTSLDVGLGLALVPAVIWMVFIYRQDRVEPEPIGLVVGVFVLGGLIATAAQGPLLEAFDVDRWHHRDGLSPWIASITIEGTVAMLCAYLAVRRSVFFTSRLDEPVDVIYATAASLGVATASNVDLVLHHQGVLPLASATAMASTTLVHVAADVVLGCGIGRRRFDSAHGNRWMSAFLGGWWGRCSSSPARARSVARSIRSSVSTGAQARRVVLVGSHVLDALRAHEALEEEGWASMSEAPNELQIERRPAVDLGVWVIAVVLLGSGYAYARSTEPAARRVFAFEGAMHASLPAGWSSHEEEGRFVAQLPGLDGVPPTVVVEPLTVPDDEEGAALFFDLELTRMQEARASGGVGFRVLHVDERDVPDGTTGTWVWYAIVREPPGASPRGRGAPGARPRRRRLGEKTRNGHAWHVGAFEPLRKRRRRERRLASVVEGIRFSE